MDAVQIFNQIIGQYQSAISPMTLLSVGLARQTFTMLALITVALAWLNQILRSKVDAG